MITVLRNIIAVIVLVSLGYFVTNYYGFFQEQVGVKGASTEKAHEITDGINKDIGKQADAAAEKAGEIKVSDIAEGFARFQRIPKDINSMKEYVQEQIDGVLKSRQK